MSNFKIIALRVLKGCPKHLCKALDPNKTYFFFEGYTNTRGGEFIKKNEKREETLRIYDVKGEGKRVIPVEVSAIVGKNGEGKSSMIELMIRVINNFAYSNGYRNNQNSLSYVNDLKAALFYEMDNRIYCIRCDQDGVKWMDSHREMQINGKEDAEKLAEIKEHHQQKLFYSLVINYALYAYNSTLFKHEASGKPWLDGLFHKNDSYQTPLVLNPMRTNGDIDINNELHLARQRLMSIFTDSGNDKVGRIISDGVEALGFCFKIDENVKLLSVTLDKYFTDVDNNVCTFEELNDNNKEDVAKEMLCNFHEFWISFSELLDKNRRLVDWLKNRRERNEKTDLNKYLDIIAEADREDTEWNFHLDENLKLFMPDGDLEWMNYAQLYRLALVFALWEVLVRNGNVPIEGNIDDFLFHQDDAKSNAILYIPYKIMAILTTYPPYKTAHYHYDAMFDMMKDRWPNMSVDKSLMRDVDDILATDDYTTLKLHQTINYLKERNGDLYGAEDYGPTTEGYNKEVTFEHLKSVIERKGQSLSDLVKRLPPPVFRGDIMLKNEKEEEYMLSTISSGQMQRLNTVGDLVYHLRNLDYRLKKTERIEYDYVNVIFEEVELYFHPEYQRTLINYLLTQIERAKLKHIKGIQLMFVTHSPFILSDLSKRNILYLSKKKKPRPEEETFAANIYDLLDDHFFLKETIGELALRQIGDFIDIYQKKQKKARKTAFEKRKQEFKALIDLMAEGYMKEDLKQMYYEMLVEYGGGDTRDLEEEILRAEENVARLKAIKEGNR